MKKLLASALSLVLLVSLLTVSAAAKTSEVTLSDKYGRLYLENVISQQSMKSDDGDLIVYTVADESSLIQTLLFGYSYKIDRWLALEKNGAIQITDIPYSGWDFDTYEPDAVPEPFHYSMNATNYPGYIHVFEVEMLGHDLKLRFGIRLDPEAVPKKELTIRFDDNFYDSDIGPINDVTITNNTGAAVNGVYTLLMYSPKMYCEACNTNGLISPHKDEPLAEIYSFDLTLDPGESATYTLYFGVARSLASSKFVWVEYDDAAERARYLNSNALFETDTLEYAAEYTPKYGNYIGYYDVVDAAYLAQYPYNITLQPVAHKSF